MNEENLERDLDKVMATEVPTKQTAYVEKLPIDEDTSFDIYYDIYNEGNTDYLYIKMTENTAVAPFYYNRSFTIEELQELDDIFRTCDLKEIKEHIKSLFDGKKIKLIYDNNKEIIKMELSVVLFVTKYNVYFKLYKQMIPEEIKDEQLLNLYEIEKNKIKMIKDLASIFNSFNNQDEKAIGEKLKELIFQFEIPGIEEGQLISNEIKPEIESIFESDISIQNKINYNIFVNAKKPGKRYHINKEKNTIELRLKNITDEDWPMNDIKLVCNEQTSTIKCTVGDLIYDIGKGQDGDIQLIFDPNDLVPGKKYQCNLELFLRGEKVEDGYAEILIRVPKKKE